MKQQSLGLTLSVTVVGGEIRFRRGHRRCSRCLGLAPVSVYDRLAAATFRRYETKYSSLPYSLFALIDPDASEAERDLVIDALLRADYHDLDPYSKGFRRAHPSAAELRSFAARVALRTDFRAHTLATDPIERLNSELSRGVATRGPGRNFTQLSRENFLSQVATEHCRRGGVHPLAPKALAQSGSRERVVAAPCLRDVVQSRAGFANPACQEQVMASASQPSSSSNLAPALARVAPTGSSQAVVVHDTRFFGGQCVVERDVSMSLHSPNAVPNKTGTTEKLRKGLSPFLLERNKQEHAAKVAKGGALTSEEISNLRANFAERWEKIEDKSPFIEAYREWQHTPAHPPAASNEYRASFGCGDLAAPITEQEFHAFHQKHGWPTLADSLDAENQSSSVKGDWTRNFSCDEGFILWSRGSLPRNVPASKFDSIAKGKLIAAGMFNTISGFAPGVADSGEAMLWIEGTPSVDGEVARIVFLLGGVTYSPQVYEVAYCGFERAADEFAPEINLPCKVFLKTRLSRVGGVHRVIDFATCTELSLRLSQNFSHLKLLSASYTIPHDDGTLLWSEVTDLVDHGVLWQPGMATALNSKTKAARKASASDRTQKAIEKLAVSDPLAPANVSDAADNRRGAHGSRHRAVVGGAPQVARVRHPPQLEHGSPPDRQGGERLEDQLDQEFAEDAYRPGAHGAADRFWPDEDMDLADKEDPFSESSEEEEGEDARNPATSVETTYAGEAHAGGSILELPPGSLPEPGCVEELSSVLNRGEAPLPDEETDGGHAAAASSCGLLASSSTSAAAEPKEPWQELTEPSVSGYVYGPHGRSVMRIQRGKPVGRVTVDCFRHAGCHLLINEGRCPSNQELFKWLFEVDVGSPATDSKEARRKLTAEHLKLAKDRWVAAPRK